MLITQRWMKENERTQLLYWRSSKSGLSLTPSGSWFARKVIRLPIGTPTQFLITSQMFCIAFRLVPGTILKVIIFPRHRENFFFYPISVWRLKCGLTLKSGCLLQFGEWIIISDDENQSFKLLTEVIWCSTWYWYMFKIRTLRNFTISHA